MNSKRNFPYTWVTWITPLLAGSAKCEWAPWFRSHYRFEKLESGDTQALFLWKRDHDQMVQARADALMEQGFAVSVEDQNEVKLKGRSGILAGKPDIVAIKATEAIVIDAKSGTARASDEWQVLVYMLALPRQNKDPATDFRFAERSSIAAGRSTCDRSGIRSRKRSAT